MPDNEVTIGINVEETGGGIDKIGQKIVTGAKSTASGIESAFHRASTGIESSFDKAVSGTSSAWSKMVSEAKQGASKVGAAFGSEMSDTIKDHVADVDFSDLGGAISSGISQLGAIGGPVGLAATVIGSTFADNIATGFTRGWSAEQASLGMQIRTGLSPAGVDRLGQEAGSAWSRGFGDNLDALTRSAAVLDNALGEIDPSTSLEDAVRWSSTLEKHFGVEIPRSADIAGRMIHQGLAESTEDAYDTMIGASQKYQTAYEDILDVTREFGTTFSELGISGAAAADFVGEAWTQGLVPTIDRAGELFEEFVIEITTGAEGRAAPALDKLGISTRKVQEALADGRGREAIQLLANELLDMEDISKRNELAIQIFGTAIESAADKTAILELIAEVGNLGDEFEGTAEKAAGMEEQAVTGMERLKRDAEDLASDAGRNFGGFYDDMANRGQNPWEELVADTEEALEFIGLKAEDVGPRTGRAVEDIGVKAAKAFGGARGDALDLSAGLDEATASAEELDAAFSDMASRFDGDAAIRGLYDELASLSDGLEDAEGASYDMATGFDLTTESGRAAAAQMEAVAGELLNVADQYRTGQIRSEDFEQAQRDAESAIRDVAAELGYNDAQADSLVSTYLSLIGLGDISTDVELTGNAKTEAARILGELREIDGYEATATIRTSYYSTGSKPSTYNVVRGFGRYAAGGPISAAAGGGFGAPVLVNDGAGQESARLPNGNLVMLPTGSTVNTHEDTERMIQSGEIGGGGSSRVVIELRSGGTALDDMLLEVLRKAIRNQGGGALEVLGR